MAIRVLRLAIVLGIVMMAVPSPAAADSNKIKLTLTPTSMQTPITMVGGFTATLTDGGNPMPNQPVVFTKATTVGFGAIWGYPLSQYDPQPTSVTAMTDAQGVATVNVQAVPNETPCCRKASSSSSQRQTA
jgi:hypothetical protein